MEDINKKLKKDRSLNYVRKDFEGYRQSLEEYAKVFFPGVFNDYTQTSFAGLMLDLVSYVGDVNSYYLDHQFHETNPITATESQNIERHLRTAGVKIVGASPATTTLSLSVKVPSKNVEGKFLPDEDFLPKIKKGSTFNSISGILFSLTRDIDFSKKDPYGNLAASYVVDTVSSSGNPNSFKMFLPGSVVSGKLETQNFRINDSHVPYRKIDLSNSNITEVLSVIDSEGNLYYEVESLTQDSVFKLVDNSSTDLSDSYYSPETLKIVPAPRRFIKKVDISSRRTTLQFGSGDALTFDDDVIPDPSELSLGLYGKEDFPKSFIDPNTLLNTRTLGVSPKSTTLSVTYRHGGGLRHNVSANSIIYNNSVSFIFNPNLSITQTVGIQNSLTVTNPRAATGGQSAPTIEELKSRIAGFRNAQSRIVTKQDLLARLYTMPASLGRVYRAGIRSNPNNPLASQLFITSLDVDGKLTVSSDSLKLSTSNYLNEFRLCNDSIDILDARILNFAIKVELLVKSDFNPIAVSSTLISNLRDYFQLKYCNIDQPVNLSDVMNISLNIDGVLSVDNIEIRPRVGEHGGQIYSTNSFNPKSSIRNNMVFGPPGSIFEIKYPDTDIQVVVS